MKETQLQMNLGEEVQEPTQPSPEEMIQLLSRTVIQQQEEIKQLKDELESLPKLPEVEEAESSKQRRYIMAYLDDELEYAKLKVKELKHHLVDYPEDSYSHTDLQNCLLHINYLNAMKRRLYLR